MFAGLQIQEIWHIYNLLIRSVKAGALDYLNWSLASLAAAGRRAENLKDSGRLVPVTRHLNLNGSAAHSREISGSGIKPVLLHLHPSCHNKAQTQI